AMRMEGKLVAKPLSAGGSEHVGVPAAKYSAVSMSPPGERLRRSRSASRGEPSTPKGGEPQLRRGPTASQGQPPPLKGGFHNFEARGTRRILRVDRSGVAHRPRKASLHR